MTEIDETLISGEFAAYREALAPEVHPAGPVVVRATVRRRRRRAVAATAAAVVLAVVVPVAANAALDRSSGPPPTPGQTGQPTPSPTTPSPGPSSASPTPSTASPTPVAPDGRISRAQLLAARVDLASWPGEMPPTTCTSVDVRLRTGPLDESVPAVLGDLAYGDLDNDGAIETVALVGCRYGEATAKQLVAFDRDAAGRIMTMGPVVGTRDGMENITDFSVEPDGHVRVDVADIQPCCSTPNYWARKQWRTYGWTGERFIQTAGPTGWGPDPRLTDLTLTGGQLVLGPPDATGKRAATLTLSVSNEGPVDVPLVGFAELDLIGKADGGDWSRCRVPADRASASCLLPALRAGERRSYTFRFLLDSADLPPTASARVVHFDSEERYWPDLNPKDDHVDVRVAG